MRQGVDPRSHYYLTRCADCPEWYVECPQAPFKAEREARRHAKRRTGHTAYVIDVTALSVVYRRRYDALTVSDEPTF